MILNRTFLRTMFLREFTHVDYGNPTNISRVIGIYGLSHGGWERHCSRCVENIPLCNKCLRTVVKYHFLPNYSHNHCLISIECTFIIVIKLRILPSPTNYAKNTLLSSDYLYSKTFSFIYLFKLCKIV